MARGRRLGLRAGRLSHARITGATRNGDLVVPLTGPELRALSLSKGSLKQQLSEAGFRSALGLNVRPVLGLSVVAVTTETRLCEILQSLNAAPAARIARKGDPAALTNHESTAPQRSTLFNKLDAALLVSQTRSARLRD